MEALKYIRAFRSALDDHLSLMPLDRLYSRPGERETRLELADRMRERLDVLISRSTVGRIRARAGYLSDGNGYFVLSGRVGDNNICYFVSRASVDGNVPTGFTV